MEELDPAFVHEFQESTVSRLAAEGIVATAVAESLQMPLWAWREVLADLLGADFAHELGGITAPTLLVAGERDELAPHTEQMDLVGAIPDAARPRSEADSYAIQDAVMRRLGERAGGWKVGYSPGGGIFCAPIYAAKVHASPASLPARRVFRNSS